MAETAFEKGHNFASHILSSSVSNFARREYTQNVAEVEDLIKDLAKKINTINKNLPDASFSGFAAEEMHAGTFNIHAKAAGSTNFATAGGYGTGDETARNLYGSVDVRVHRADGPAINDYGSKYYANAKETAKQQSMPNKLSGNSKYNKQYRLNPSDQNEEVKRIAKFRAEHEKTPDNWRQGYKETSELSVDRITDNEGNESNPFSKKDALRMAKDAKEGRIDEEGKILKKEYGVRNDLMTPEAVMKEAMKAGITAGIISAVMQTAPEIIKAFDYLIKNKQIDLATIGKIGLKGLTAGAEGFMLGSITRVLQLKIVEGAFGAAFSHSLTGSTASMVLATTVSFVWTSIKNSLLYISGKIDGRTLANNMVDYTLISGGFLIGSTLGNILTLGLPIIGMFVGTFVGSAFALTYNIVKKKFISFCADTGFTCFGLVDQDYTLPESVLSDMGIDLVPISRTDVSRTELSTTQLQGGINRTNYETVDVKIVKRGVIGLNKIGFIV